MTAPTPPAGVEVHGPQWTDDAPTRWVLPLSDWHRVVWHVWPDGRVLLDANSYVRISDPGRLRLFGDVCRFLADHLEGRAAEIPGQLSLLEGVA